MVISGMEAMEELKRIIEDTPQIVMGLLRTPAPSVPDTDGLARTRTNHPDSSRMVVREVR